MHRLLYVLLLLTAAACGGESAAPSIAAAIRMDGLMSDDVQTISVFIFGPKRADGILLVCDSLTTSDATQKIQTSDARLEQLGHASINFTQSGSSQIAVDNVTPGDGLVVYAEARGAGDAMVGSGCYPQPDDPLLDLGSGATAHVQITIWAAP